MLYKARQVGVCRTKGGKEQFTLRRLDMVGQVWPFRTNGAKLQRKDSLQGRAGGVLSATRGGKQLFRNGCKAGQVRPCGTKGCERQFQTPEKRMCRCPVERKVSNGSFKTCIADLDSLGPALGPVERQVPNSSFKTCNRYRFLGPSGTTSAQQQFQDL